jgi:thiol-disulfide isomerase/thioredoxin
VPPTVKLTKAQISGKIICKTKDSQFPTLLHISIPHPVSGQISDLKTKTDSEGNFMLKVDLETFPSVVALCSDNNPSSAISFVVSNQKTEVSIYYNSSNEIDSITGVSSFKDAINEPKIIDQLIDYRSKRPRRKLYDKEPNALPQFADTVIEERLNKFVTNSVLTNSMKNIISKDFTLFMYNTHVFDYKTEMLSNYNNIIQRDPDNSVSFSTPTKQYYAFLKKFDLNNPQYLYCLFYPEFIRTILDNEILDIPPIGDTSIDNWLTAVKKDMIELTGLKDGLFYDMLVSNSYSKQLLIKAKPLSEKQKENILNYFKNKSFVDILLKTNDYVLQQGNITSNINKTLIVKDSGTNPQGKLVDEIAAKYKNKVVLIDFWATWCSPCRKAISEMKPLETELKNRDVVFVYVTNGSSPKKLWQELIEGIGGEHYYLNEKEWESISCSKKYGFDGIPTYLIFDKKGDLKQKFTAFPGVEKVKELIEKCL